MRVAIVTDAFPPLRSSGAVQLRDLSREFVRDGHEATVLVASPYIDQPFVIDNDSGVTVARLRSPRTKDLGYIRRLAGELMMPFAMFRNYRKSPLADRVYDAVIWYSPSIFLAPIVRKLKQRNDCPSYLILRDVFPQWAADMGLMTRGPAFRLLDMVARYQYRSADVIGVQTPGNLAFFERFRTRNAGIKIEVLQNWIADAPNIGCSIDIAATKLAGRRIFVYAGNMGVAQQMDKLVHLAAHMRDRADIGFLFVGRGSEVQRLQQLAANLDLHNILFEDEISPDHIAGLYSQCQAGMICLDSRHQTHNIPGKFLTYMQAGLPVLASINCGNDLAEIVENHSVGRVSTCSSGSDLPALAEAMLQTELNDPKIGARCRKLSLSLFSARTAVEQITEAVRGPR